MTTSSAHLTPVPSHGRKGVVLLVEDDRDLAQVLTMILGDEFDVEWAETASEATYLLKTKAYDVLVSDYLLLDGNGLELINLALQEHPNLSAILITAFPSAPAITRVQALGRFVVLAKPLEPEVVLDWVRNNAASTQLMRILSKIAKFK